MHVAAKRHRDGIGGYQVIKKWLSYREKPLLGRGRTSEEVRYVMKMARHLAALVACNRHWMITTGVTHLSVERNRYRGSPYLLSRLHCRVGALGRGITCHVSR